MEHLFNHLPPAAPVFPPAASTFPVPVPVFPTPPPPPPPMPPQQVQLGEVVPATNNFPPVHTDSTPTLYSTSSSSTHPPYPQMITEAIGMLRERDGSSRQAIAKYIERVYPNLPSNHSGLLTQHLKRMKDSGELVMVKHSYVLAASAPAVLANLSENVPNRISSQPPQLNTLMNYSHSQAQQALVQEPPINNVSASPGPVTVPEALFASIGLVDGQLDPVPLPKKRPGRPKKVVGPGSATPTTGVVVDASQPATTTDVAADGTASLPLKRRPGRPPRNATRNVGTAAPVIRARGRGRPRQNASVYTGKPRGRPRRNVEASASVNAVHGGGTEAIPTAVYVGDGAVAVGRKRGRPGRPPKFANELHNPRNLSGRPLGRHKTNEPAAVVQVSNLQQLLAYQELKSKLDFFQSRIKHNVGILKPVLNSQSASIASGALQELEELATLDVNAASNLHDLQLQPQNQV